MSQTPEEKESPFKQYVKYTGAGFEILAYILIFVAIGYGLDYYLQTEIPWFTLIFSLLGCAAAIYKVIQRFGNIK